MDWVLFCLFLTRLCPRFWGTAHTCSISILIAAVQQILHSQLSKCWFSVCTGHVFCLASYLVFTDGGKNVCQHLFNFFSQKMLAATVGESMQWLQFVYFSLTWPCLLDLSGEPGLVQCILGYRNLNYQESSFVWTQKSLLIFMNFIIIYRMVAILYSDLYFNHLYDSCFFTLTVFMLVLNTERA